MGIDEPTAQNPGALTKAQADSAPWMADPSQVRKKARKEVSMVQMGLSARHALMGTGELFAQVYGGGRSLYNPLTFAIVKVERGQWGGGARATAPFKLFGLDNRGSIGVDVQGVSDHRFNWANCNGVATPTASCADLSNEQGARSLDQQEKVSSVGPYVRDELTFADRYTLSAGIRADYVKFEVDDNFPVSENNPDDSGDRTLHAWSPMVGLVAKLTPLHSIYANVSRAFETPTTTELGNQANGSAGFNPDLQPQLSTTYELGLKGIVLNRVQYDLAGFDTEVHDELIAFEVPGRRTGARTIATRDARAGRASRRSCSRTSTRSRSRRRTRIRTSASANMWWIARTSQGTRFPEFRCIRSRRARRTTTTRSSRPSRGWASRRNSSTTRTPRRRPATAS